MQQIGEAIQEMGPLQKHLALAGNTPTQTSVESVRAGWLADPAKVKGLCEAMRIPSRYRDCRIENLEGFEQEKRSAMTPMEFEGSVFLTGPCGTGKTHLAVGLAWYWLSMKMPIVIRQDGFAIAYGLNFKGERASDYIPTFVPVAELLLEIKRTYGGGEEKESEVLNRYSTAALLILDDIGSERITDWTRQIFYTIIDRRYREFKQTIITSNKSLDDISTMIDDRIASRIVGMGPVVTLHGTDWRLKPQSPCPGRAGDIVLGLAKNMEASEKG